MHARIRLGIAALGLFAAFSMTSQPAAAQCLGDCNEDGAVTIDELVTAVSIALGSSNVTSCPAADRGDGAVTIDELVAAVGNALNGCPIVGPPAEARRITNPQDLIGGPLALGRVGDWLLANDRIRVIIRDVGRELSFVLTYGGNIIDADLARPDGESGRDQFGAMSPLINISSTVNVQQIEVINDGSDGQPAVIRTMGVDDLFDAIDPTNAIRGVGAGAVPPSAQDRDIPVQVMTEYSLAPGAESVRIETAVHNEGDETLRIYIGDFINGSGELDLFIPSLGFGEALLRLETPYLAYTGIDRARGLSYGIIPDPLMPGGFPAASFTQSGLTVSIMGQDVLSVLLGGAPGAMVIPAGETRSFVRHFVVGDGDVNSVAQVHTRRNGVTRGRIAGTVQAGGEPLSGAVVSLVRKPGEAGAQYNVIDSFRTDENGEYAGIVPAGDYLVMAKAEGYPYDSGERMPTEHPVTVPAGGLVEQDFSLPDTGWLRVTVENAAADPMPGRVTIVGFDPAPDPMNSQTVAIIQTAGFVFGSPMKDKQEVPFGIVEARFIGPSGDSEVFPLPPGEYGVVVTRGPEYSAYRETIEIESGETTSVQARLARVLDTTGFVSADYHVHLINSADSNVTRDERLLTMAAEGVEHFAATDHDFLTDLSADVDRLGLTPFVSTTVSAEITTFNIGHFNAYPLSRNPDSIIGGAPDWGRAGVPPGEDYPSLGSYDLSPDELFDLAGSRIDGDPMSGVIQANHFNSDTLGYFHLTGIDTALVPPQSFTDPTRIRQDPSIANFYDDTFTTLELWIEASRAQTELFLDANLGDWFNLLNQGDLKSGTADSDTHHTLTVQAGGPRNFVASSVDDPAQVDTREMASSVRAGRVVGSSAPFVRVQLIGDDEQVASLDLGQPQMVAATTGTATLRIDVQSALWAEFDTIEVYTNVVPTPEPDENFHMVEVPRYVAAPTRVLRAGDDFTVETVEVDPEISGARRHEATVEMQLAVSEDAWVVVVVRGTDGVSRPLWPMNPKDLETTDNETLADLLDGNLGEGGNPALAFTNPLFIDANGNGTFDPPAL